MKEYKMSITPFEVNDDSINVMQVTMTENKKTVLIWLHYLNEYGSHDQINYNKILTYYLCAMTGLSSERQFEPHQVRERLDGIIRRTSHLLNDMVA